MFSAHASDFTRLHRQLVTHLAVVSALAWGAALYAALHAPWVANIMPFIDPASPRAIATGPYLFTAPTLLLIALALSYFGRELLFQLRVLRSSVAGMALAAAISVTLFALAVDRAVNALRISWA
ncbi:MAG: hypothetical protein EA385_03570 [Salinarimonadaceae bacterium]|nr:MAG: hypothetical protein EA385_03570 [Salinarimonadaceae bacterium]